MTATLFRALDDETLLRRAHIERDPLTSTDLEGELAERLELARDELAELDRLREIVDRSDIEVADLADQLNTLLEFETSPAQLRELLTVLEESDCLAPADLRTRLERAERFDQVEQSATDLVDRLQAIVTPATKETT